MLESGIGEVEGSLAAEQVTGARLAQKRRSLPGCDTFCSSPARSRNPATATGLEARVVLRASIGLNFHLSSPTLCVLPRSLRLAGRREGYGKCCSADARLANLAAVDRAATTWVVASPSLLLGLWIAAFVQERRHAARATAFQTVAAHYQRFLRQVIDTNPNLIFVKDWEGKYVLANEATAEFHGNDGSKL